jgi:hypothetical protein
VLQVSSTAQLILDPYYRTIRGFFILIEKDWCGFGHKFFDRIGHGRSGLGDEAKETSPVFLQWLDVVGQLLYQFPRHFEFNENLLVFIADALHSCQFGTFVGNSERERKVELKASSRTNSLWTHVLQPHILPRFMNSTYLPPQCALSHNFVAQPVAGNQSGGGSILVPLPATAAAVNPGTFRTSSPGMNGRPGVGAISADRAGAIWPSTRRVRFWERYFCRWDVDCHPRATSGESWKDGWV